MGCMFPIIRLEVEFMLPQVARAKCGALSMWEASSIFPANVSGLMLMVAHYEMVLRGLMLYIKF